LQANYITVLTNDEGPCSIVVPGVAEPVLKAMEQNHCQTEAILLAHHQHDQVDGLAEICGKVPHVVLYGPAGTQN